ncbi:glycine zipper 2TM domain-containing protein [Thermomonas paludicola]|uniref:glycine zipper 2TM domain-containing protein n=1 Tax=Thermomonas paludicola TaxID=2884874 RepID=UPI002114A514|nr:glycine zipper 2TM domain-containing protein [Thermomonas paludicola]
MKRLINSLLVLGLVAGSSTAFAQSSADRYGDAYSNDGGSEGYFDYARVIRVDPVLDEGYRNATDYGRRCRDSTTAGRYESDGYYSRGYDDYGRRPRSGEAGRNVATIAGGIVGAVLGSKVGGGSGTYAATAVGSMLGGMAGREIYDQNQQNRYVRGGTVRVCDPEPVRGGYSGYSGYSGSASAYDVTYEYNGRRYTRRMDYNPGDRIRVRVDVVPQ